MKKNYCVSITKDELNKLPRYTYQGKIELIESKKDALDAINDVKGEKVLGFDTETRAAFKKGERYDVSLLQLATGPSVYLFRLNKLPLLPELFEILSDPNIVKAGVGIRDDIKALKNLHPFSPQNFVDLADVAKQKKIENFGLRALTGIVLGKRLSKKAKISNWDRKNLTPEQINYAACDGAVGYEIYREFFRLDT
ncbi:MAG: 3'-5' exonuclease [Bacteriovoracaceae bacterium]